VDAICHGVKCRHGIIALGEVHTVQIVIRNNASPLVGGADLGDEVVQLRNRQRMDDYVQEGGTLNRIP
jgi:hypothetical protein